MFNLDKHEARITSVNPRREKHGKEGKPGFDIKFSVSTANTTLDCLQKGLKEALFRKAQKGEQLDAFSSAGDLVALRFPNMEPVRLDTELEGYEIAITGGLESSPTTDLIDVKLDGFTIAPIEGGSAKIDFSVHVPTSETVIDEMAECIDWWMYEKVFVSVVAPNEQTAEAANDDDGAQGAAA